MEHHTTRFRLLNEEGQEESVWLMEAAFTGNEKDFVSNILPHHGITWSNLARRIKEQDNICAFGVAINDGDDPKQSLFDFVRTYVSQWEVVAYIDWGYVNGVVCGSGCDPRKLKKTLTDNFNRRVHVHRKTKALSDDLPHVLRRHFCNRHFLIINSPTGFFRELFGTMHP